MHVDTGAVGNFNRGCQRNLWLYHTAFLHSWGPNSYQHHKCSRAVYFASHSWGGAFLQERGARETALSCHRPILRVVPAEAFLGGQKVLSEELCLTIDGTSSDTSRGRPSTKLPTRTARLSDE